MVHHGERPDHGGRGTRARQEAPLARAGQRGRDHRGGPQPPRDHPGGARQPHVVLPVAGRGARRPDGRAAVARGGRGPAGHGLLRAHGIVPPARGPRPGPRGPHARAGHRRCRTAGGHLGPRLGRAHLPGLGAGTPAAPRGDHHDQHRRSPRQRRAHSLGPEARAQPRRARTPHVRDHRVPGHHPGPVRSRPDQGPQEGLQGSVHLPRAPRGHRALRRRHPRRTGPPLQRGVRAHRRADERARGPHAAAVGHQRSRVPAALPRGPHTAGTPRGRPPLRRRQAPAARGPGHRPSDPHVAR